MCKAAHKKAFVFIEEFFYNQSLEKEKDLFVKFVNRLLLRKRRINK